MLWFSVNIKFWGALFHPVHPGWIHILPHPLLAVRSWARYFASVNLSSLAIKEGLWYYHLLHGAGVRTTGLIYAKHLAQHLIYWMSSNKHHLWNEYNRQCNRIFMIMSFSVEQWQNAKVKFLRMVLWNIQKHSYANL